MDTFIFFAEISVAVILIIILTAIMIVIHQNHNK
jgi:hypothetical protein